MTMKVNARCASVTLVAVLTALTASAARADDTTTDTAPKTVTKKKPARKTKKAAKPAPPPVEPETAAAASEPTLAPEPKPAPVVETKPATATPPAATTNLGAPGGDRAAEDRTATRAAKEHPFSAAPLFGYGTDNLHVGIGVRAGYNIQAGSGSVYVGGAFMYHFGTSSETTVAGQTVGASVSAFYPSVEGGYELRPIDRLAIRPYGGIGIVFASATIKGYGGSEISSSNNVMAFYPGCAVTYDIPNAPVFVGGDARLLIPLENGGTSFGMFATGGMRF
jgi:hypothetical protein